MRAAYANRKTSFAEKKRQRKILLKFKIQFCRSKIGDVLLFKRYHAQIKSNYCVHNNVY